MPSAVTLLVLRHATAASGRPGGQDSERRLTAHGRSEASGVGDFLRTSGLVVDHVLCSSAVRTRETLEQLALDQPGAAPTVELVPRLYQASADELIELVDQVAAGTVLVVGHNPTVAVAVNVLTDPAISSAAALVAVAHRFPPATLARLSLGAAGPNPASAALVGIRIADGRDGKYVK
ncbi:histidine phosphatase family protein [uncultured Friedmanniella sp.]|uniref:SixA phosphatase family protein n=1 Tax=uncultured Friedmanniella sp. TaxID=335381 RepID=UPI0035C99E4E